MTAVDPKRLLADVGRRIAEIRVQREETQEELAERAGFSARYVQRVESGDENLTIRSLAMFASVLHAPVSSFFEPPASRTVRIGRPPKKGRPKAR